MNLKNKIPVNFLTDWYYNFGWVLAWLKIGMLDQTYNMKKIKRLLLKWFEAKKAHFFFKKTNQIDDFLLLAFILTIKILGTMTIRNLLNPSRLFWLLNRVYAQL